MFLCGTLQPGRDGVGDYTRRLAGELIRQGHIASIIALNDKYVTICSEETQNDNSYKIPVLRLPGTLGWRKKISLAKQFLNQQSSDWLSLQYVPFAFSKKGIPFNLGSWLQELGNGRKWHIMFHELWLGMELGANAKMRVWGTFQKKLIVRMTRKLKPLSVHSQIDLYVHQLKKIGINAQILQLFGNLLVEKGVENASKNSNYLKFLVFGNIHHGAPISEWAENLLVWCKMHNYRCLIVFAGANGSEGIKWREVFETKGFDVETFGFLPDEKLVSLFYEADIGITSTPELLVGKSGSVAAMKEFGLPVVCVSRDWQVKGIKNDNKLTYSLEECLAIVLKNERKINVNALFNTSVTFSKELNLYG